MIADLIDDKLKQNLEDMYERMSSDEAATAAFWRPAAFAPSQEPVSQLKNFSTSMQYDATVFGDIARSMRR